MNIGRRALYHLLRMNWLEDPNNVKVEPWQVENYRDLSTETLFQRLNALNIQLDRPAFQVFSENFDDPETMAEDLIAEKNLEMDEEDKIYLLIFELWRRLAPEKQTLSIFCDEFDHLIYLYDQGKLQDLEAIQDAVANLQVILEENSDYIKDPQQVFEYVSAECANNLEEFLYDYISDQIDLDQDYYASELLDGFENYMHDKKWFDCLRIRLILQTDPESVQPLIEQLMEETGKEQDLDFNFELLSLLARTGGKKNFRELILRTVPLLNSEEDFQDLLEISAEYYRLIDQEEEEQEIMRILQDRKKFSSLSPIYSKDPAISQFLNLISS